MRSLRFSLAIAIARTAAPLAVRADVLATKYGDKLQGFAGADKKWVWPDAVIEVDNVVLSSPQVATPVAVRYAFAPTHPWANLFNRDGLPAIPFRTDSDEK